MTLIKNDKEYVAWIAELSKRYRQSQIKAAIKVNSEMLKFYWSVGKDISERQFDNKYGTHFYENLSRDLYAELGVKKGLSPSSLWYTKRFYDLYSTIPSFLQHTVGKSEASNLQQVVGKIKETNSQQVADDFEILFKIPWGHHCRIIDLLFYIIPLHRYCVIEVKTTEFDFPDLGQLAGYTAMVDDLMNTPVENAAIGLLICKEKNTVLARYALSRINTPIGISEYEVAKRQLPKELQDQLPTEEEIEQGLNKSSELDS